MADSIEKVAMDVIDDPHAPMRSQMDDEKLDELTASIKSYGLIQPITLRKVGSRYEVVAGHRRFRACVRAGVVLVPSIVRVLDDKESDTLRMHENLFREDVNPVDEARYIRKMIDVHQADPVELARMTGKSATYLQARYDLLDYPKYLVDEVEAGRVSLTAAAWLAKISEDGIRSEYTRFAALGGITARRAEAWFRSWELGQLPRDASTYIAPVTGVPVEPLKLMMPCVLCGHGDEVQNMMMHYAHNDCVKAANVMQKERQQ